MLRVFFWNKSHFGERGALWLHKDSTKMTVTIPKANIPKALQVGVPPTEYVIPMGQPRDSQLYSRYIMLRITANEAVI